MCKASLLRCARKRFVCWNSNVNLFIRKLGHHLLSLRAVSREHYISRLFKRQFKRLDDYRYHHVTSKKKVCSFISGKFDDKRLFVNLLVTLPTELQLSQATRSLWIKISFIHGFMTLYCVFGNYDLWYRFLGWLIKST